MEKEYDFIINPKARSGMGMKAWQKIESELKARHINYRVYLTKRRGHAAKTAAFITADDKRHTIVVLGGDGTVNEVVNGIKRPDLITFGYIPIGSSNDFARGLKLPKDPMKALQSVLSPEESDFCRCRTDFKRRKKPEIYCKRRDGVRRRSLS